MSEFNAEQFIKITFDIMPRVAEQLQRDWDDTSVSDECLLNKTIGFQTKFNQLLAQYEGELLSKYKMTFREYNEKAKIYEHYIYKYLKEHPDLEKKYTSLKENLKMKI